VKRKSSEQQTMTYVRLQSKPFAQLSWPKELAPGLAILWESALAFCLMFAALPSCLRAPRLPLRVEHL